MSLLVNTNDPYATPPSVAVSVTGLNINGQRVVYAPTNYTAWASRFLDAVPLGPLVKRAPSVGQVATGVTEATIKAGEGVAKAAVETGKAAAAGVKTAAMLLVIALVGYLLFPVLVRSTR